MIDSFLNMDLKVKARVVYKQTDKMSRGVLTILVDTIRNFVGANAAESAASMAYYTLFSLFPLLVFLIGSVSSILEN